MGLLPCSGRLGRGFLVCLRNSVRLVEFDSGWIQVEGLQYVGHLVVRGWFLKYNCFFIVWMRWVANFGWGNGWRLELLGQSWDQRQVLQFQLVIVGGKRFLMVLFLKLVCSSWRIQHLINLKIFVVHVSETSFLHECLSMVTWVGLPLLSTWSHLYRLYWCVPRKKWGEILGSNRCWVPA